MTRVRSTDLWFNAPGIVAAYQPIAAPDSLAARQNVGNDARMAGLHTAMPGTLPTWSGATGWAFLAANSQYLTTGITPTASWTVILRASGVAMSEEMWAFGNYVWVGWGIQLNTNNRTIYYNGDFREVSAVRTGGVWAMAGGQGYYNGAADGTPFSATATPGEIYIGDISGVYRRYQTAIYQTFAIFRVTLSLAHVAQYSRQMAYCHVNTDWSAWGRRRRYYYAPSVAVAAGTVGIYGRRGSVALPGGVRIEAVR